MVEMRRPATHNNEGVCYYHTGFISNSVDRQGAAQRCPEDASQGASPVVQESVPPKMAPGPDISGIPFTATNGLGLRGPILHKFLYSDEWLFFIATNGPRRTAAGVQQPAIPNAGNASFSNGYPSFVDPICHFFPARLARRKFALRWA